MLKKSLLIIFVLILSGCARPMEMTKWQFESAWKTKTTQLTDEQHFMIDKTNFCKNLNEHEIQAMGVFTVSEDVALACDKVDAKIASLKGNAYYLKGFDWISGAWGTTLHVLFNAYKCDNFNFPKED